MTEDSDLQGVRVSTEELRKAQRQLCEDVYQILRRLDELEKGITRLEQRQQTQSRR